MPRSKEFLAQAMNTDADGAPFEKMAADYRSELDAADAAKGQPSAAPTASGDAVPTDDAAAAQPQIGASETASTPSSTDE
jgi:hypothetical protein